MPRPETKILPPPPTRLLGIEQLPPTITDAELRTPSGPLWQKMLASDPLQVDMRSGYWQKFIASQPDVANPELTRLALDAAKLVQTSAINALRRSIAHEPLGSHLYLEKPPVAATPASLLVAQTEGEEGVLLEARLAPPERPAKPSGLITKAPADFFIKPATADNIPTEPVSTNVADRHNDITQSWWYAQVQDVMGERLEMMTETLSTIRGIVDDFAKMARINQVPNGLALLDQLAIEVTHAQSLMSKAGVSTRDARDMLTGMTTEMLEQALSNEMHHVKGDQTRQLYVLNATRMVSDFLSPKMHVGTGH